MANASHSSTIGYVLSLAIVVLTSISARMYRETFALQIAEAGSIQSHAILCQA